MLRRLIRMGDLVRRMRRRSRGRVCRRRKMDNRRILQKSKKDHHRSTLKRAKRRRKMESNLVHLKRPNRLIGSSDLKVPRHLLLLNPHHYDPQLPSPNIAPQIYRSSNSIPNRTHDRNNGSTPVAAAPAQLSVTPKNVAHDTPLTQRLWAREKQIVW